MRAKTNCQLALLLVFMLSYALPLLFPLLQTDLILLVVKKKRKATIMNWVYVRSPYYHFTLSALR